MHDYPIKALAFDGSRSTDEFVAAINRTVARLAAATQTPMFASVPRPPQIGDKVRAVADGYVQAINADGSYVLAATRTPFGEGEVVATIAATRNARLTTVERAPAAPVVGETITGKRVRETPWRRGTVLVDVEHAVEYRYVLLASGEWLNVDSGTTFGFVMFGDDEAFVVESAPGKPRK